MNVGICKLCKEEKPLCTQSHIIPNFLYKVLKGDVGNFYKLETLKMIYFPKGKLQTGIFYKDILCIDCENKVLSRYEKYGSKVLNSGAKLNIYESGVNRVSIFEINEIDYKTSFCFYRHTF